MGKIYVIYNTLSGNNTFEDIKKELDALYQEDIEYVDSFEIGEDLNAFFDKVYEEDKVVLCGGDGTINYFVNHIDVADIKSDILYYPAGSGNDFCHDIKDDNEGPVYPLRKYIEKLPLVEVDGIKRKFINGMGCGLDGYVCYEGNKNRELNPGKAVNYTGLAVKGLLYDFKPGSAKVTIDGITDEYKNVWMVASMHGRYYGGGMKCAPDQDRNNADGTVSVVIVHSKSRVKLLGPFSKVFKGGHVKHKSVVTVLTGNLVKVEFDRPFTMQVDGESMQGITNYKVYRE